MRLRRMLEATVLVLLVAAPSLFLAAPVGAVTVAWDTIIADGNYFTAMDTFGGHTFVLLEEGLT
jgi:hypothetical protein